MDCVLTEWESDAHKLDSPSAFHGIWDKMVCVCENCPLYEAISLVKSSNPAT